MNLSSVETRLYDSQMRANEAQEEEMIKRGYEIGSLGEAYIPRNVIHSFRLIPINPSWDYESQKLGHQINSFANLFYFSVLVLGKDKFQQTSDARKNLHLQMCLVVMKDGLKEVIEIPRDHYKSTIYSECFPMWRALPFLDKYEDTMMKLGCSDIYINWMKKAHRQDIRILLISEVIKNAAKLGKRIRNHYETNELFKDLFPEIIPDAKCTWTDTSLHQRRTPKGMSFGEGTFDFTGVGGALQSTHYDLSVQDDLVGRDALKSETVMNDTIEYHKLIVGAMDSDNLDGARDFDELVVGNRWSYKDLNSHIRAEEPYFNFITHSALGGCCKLHPYGETIFPEKFSLSKLSRWKKRLGSYLFSCQFLNFPINPEKCKFKTSDLRYFEYLPDTSNTAYVITPEKPIRTKIRHHVAEGDVDDDIFPRILTRYMIVDPNHAMNKGRCRHAITITGVRQDKRRIYLLKQWAKACAPGEFVETIFKLALQFKVTEVYLETVGFQKFLKFHLEYFVAVNKKEPEWKGIDLIRFKELKSSNTANAKEIRIDAFIPIVERHEFWIDVNACEEVREEMRTYGNAGSLVDILDTLGYGEQVWKFDDVDEEGIENYIQAQKNRFMRAMAVM